MLVMFINPVFDELRDAFPEQDDQIPDPLDLCTLFLLEHFRYDFQTNFCFPLHLCVHDLFLNFSLITNVISN